MYKNSIEEERPLQAKDTAKAKVRRWEREYRPTLLDVLYKRVSRVAYFKANSKVSEVLFSGSGDRGLDYHLFF